jgi:DNA repair protein RecO (recombination protein O)
MYQGAKRKGKKGQLMSPMSIINISYFQRSDSQLAKISNIDFEIINKDIPFNPLKTSVLFFMNEVILNSIKEEAFNPQLYDFIKSSIQLLDVQNALSNFPLKFLLSLLGQLGYFPTIIKNGIYFDQLNGVITPNEPSHPYYLNPLLTKLLINLTQEPFSNNGNVIPKKDKKALTLGLLDYYKLKIDGFKPLKSLEVIEAVLD